jgi:transposase-like protein
VPLWFNELFGEVEEGLVTGNVGGGGEEHVWLILSPRRKERKVVVVPDTKSKTVLPIVDKTVEKGSQIYTNEYPIYDRLAHMGIATIESCTLKRYM